MSIGAIVGLWVASGALFWMAFAVYLGRVTVGDLALALMCGAVGPTVPIIIGLWWCLGQWLRVSQVVLWARRKPPTCDDKN